MKKNEESRYQIQALVKGLYVLECFRDTDEYGVTELAQIVHLPESSLQRIINTLEWVGYLYQNLENKKYRLSPRILQTYIKGSSFLKWKGQARNRMVALNEIFGENVNLAVRDQDKCSYIELVESKHLLRPNFTLSDTYPLHCTSLGRSLLCDLSDDLLRSILPECIEPMTPYTLTDREQVLKIIRETRIRKYAVDDEEFSLGLSCVGGPIFGVGGKVIAAISVIAPKVRMPAEKVNEIIPALLETAEKISEDFKNA